MNILPLPLAVLASVLLLGACAVAPPNAPADAPAAPAPAPAPVTDDASLAAIETALAGDHRAAANRARDAWRHPKETLAFFGLRQDMAVMEIWPGPGGWYTEVLAPVLKDKGRYLAAQWDPAADSEFIQNGLKAFRAKLDARPDVYGKVEVVALQHPTTMTPVAPGTLDMVLTFRNIHNWMPRDAAVPMLEAMFAALKPGGILGVVEHRAPTSEQQDPKARTGYVRQDYAIELVTGVGFEFLGASEVNANPADTKDYDQGVWTLPPTLRLGEVDRAKYLAIGESDRFTLRFRKPVAAR